MYDKTHYNKKKKKNKKKRCIDFCKYLNTLIFFINAKVLFQVSYFMQRFSPSTYLW